jgi:hypothetical protein
VTFLTAALDAPAEKVEPRVYVGQARLGLRQAQTHRPQYRRHLAPQRLGIGLLAVDHDHEVVGIADEFHDRTAGAAMLDAAPFRYERLPLGVEVLIENGQGDALHHHRAVRCGCGTPPTPVGGPSHRRAVGEPLTGQGHVRMVPSLDVVEEPARRIHRHC